MSVSSITATAAGRRARPGVAAALFAVLGLIWGSNFLFVKWALPLVSPAQIVLLRVLFGFAALLTLSLAKGALRWRHLRHAHHFLAMAMLATILDFLAFTQGTAHLLSSVAGMLSGAIPLFAFLVALLFLRQEAVNRRTGSGVLLGFLGILLIARPWQADLGAVDPVGVAWMALGAVSVGCAFVYTRRFLSPLGLSPLALTTYQIGLALVILLATTDLHGIGRVFGDTRATLGLVLGLGLCGTGLAYVMYYDLVDRLGAVAASGVTYIPPVVALALGLLDGEPVRALDLVAMGSILLGVFVLQSGRRPAA